jgi:hypothetical protein
MMMSPSPSTAVPERMIRPPLFTNERVGLSYTTGATTGTGVIPVTAAVAVATPAGAKLLPTPFSAAAAVPATVAVRAVAVAAQDTLVSAAQV